MSDRLRIGQLAERVGVNVETIRYYERRGLLPRSRRGAGTYRYDGQSVATVRFIKRAQRLGFTLTEVAELLQLRFDPGATCADVRGRAEAKLERVERKLRDLQAMRRALRTLTDHCDRDGPIADGCPFLETLDGNEPDTARGWPDKPPAVHEPGTRDRR